MLRYAWTSKSIRCHPARGRSRRTKFSCRCRLQSGPVSHQNTHVCTAPLAFRSQLATKVSGWHFPPASRPRIGRLSSSSGARSRVQIRSRFIIRVVENVHARSVRRLPCKPPPIRQPQTEPRQVDRARGPHTAVPAEIICIARRGW